MIKARRLKNAVIFIQTSHLTFTCSKSTIETLEKGVKYGRSYNENVRTTSLMTSFWCFFVNSEHILHLFLVFLLTLNR